MTKANSSGPITYVVGKAFSVLLGPLAVILLPGILGENGYGRYSYWFGLISVYLVVLDLGAQPMLRRFLPELTLKAPSQARMLFLISQRMKLIPLVLLGLGVLFAGQPGMALGLVVAALLGALATNLADVYYAYQRMGAHTLAVLARKLLRLLLVPSFFLIWGLPGIMAALVLAEALGFLVAAPAVRLCPPPGKRLQQRYWHFYQHGLLVFLAFFAATLVGRLPVLTAEWMVFEPEQIGRIALCVDLTYFALKELVNAISESVLPRMIVHRAEGNHEAAVAMLGLNYRAVNVVLLGAIALGEGLITSFLRLLGEGFYMAEAELRLLIIAVAFGCWNYIHSQILMMQNRSQHIAYSQISGLLTNVVFIGLVLGRLDTMLLSVGLTVAMAVSALVSYLFVRGLSTGYGVSGCFLRLLPVSAIVGTTLYVWSPQGTLDTAISVLLGGLAYVVMAWLVRGVLQEDVVRFAGALRVRWA